MSRSIFIRCCILLMSVAVVGCRESRVPIASGDDPNPIAAEPSAPQAPGQSGRLHAKEEASISVVDPKSAVAAREVVLRYARLIEDGEFPEARRLWTEASDLGAVENQLHQFRQIEATVGDPGQMEGAAGSSYIDIPMQLTGRAKDGEPLSLTGTVTLRRVNEVPGSTELQRRWHIYRVELQPRP
ncbi:MAG TPA: hypothetical protein VFT40_10480 [Sphingomicrobium sp.]|nr:hypothetical protein [Sphingomicrobium sp.]